MSVWISAITRSCVPVGVRQAGQPCIEQSPGGLVGDADFCGLCVSKHSEGKLRPQEFVIGLSVPSLFCVLFGCGDMDSA